MPNKKNDSDTEENSERPSGSESDDNSDPEDHKGAVKKQQVTASSSEESDVSEGSSDESEPEEAKKKSEQTDTNKPISKQSDTNKPISKQTDTNKPISKQSDTSLKKADEPAAKKSDKSQKSSNKKDDTKKSDTDKKVTIPNSPSTTERQYSRDGRNFGMRESFGTLRDKRKNKKEREAKDKEGIIQKKGNISRKWERKYIIVSTATRTIYIYDLESHQNERRANQAPKQVIGLDSAVIYARVQRRGAEMQSYFNIRANNRDYLFKANTPEEKSKWVAAIKSNKTKKDEDQPPFPGSVFQTPESQKKQDKHIEKASNIFMKLIGRESYLGVAKDS